MFVGLVATTGVGNPNTAISEYPQNPFSGAGVVKSNFTAATFVAKGPLADVNVARVADWTAEGFEGL